MDESPNVPMLVGLLSGLGTVLLGLLCALIYFAVVGQGGRITLGDGFGDPGSYDDEARIIIEEEEALQHMDDRERHNYFRAKLFFQINPPNSAPNTDISLSQYMAIQEKGVSAWEFELDFAHATSFVQNRTEIEFFDGTSSVQTNLPIPKQHEVYYWETKIYDKPDDTLVSIGVTTKPYPMFRLPGFHRFSIAYDSNGNRRINQPFSAPKYGPALQTGDVVGFGYRTRTGTIFYTRNGKKLEDVMHGCRINMFPTIGATGPATIHVNFGRAAFVYIEANVKKWGLAPAHGSLAPPPPYGAESDTVLLDVGSSGQQPTQPPEFTSDDETDNNSSPLNSSSVTDLGDLNPDSIGLARLKHTADSQLGEAEPRETTPATAASSSSRPGVVSPPPSYDSDTTSEPI